MHSPVRSEQDVFKGVVIIGGAIALVIAIGVLASPAVAVAAAALLVLAGVVVLSSRARGSLPEDIEVPRRGRHRHRILVIANETVEGPALLREIRLRSSIAGGAELLLVCPALASTRLQHLASDIDGARREAERRLERSLSALRRAGMDARGMVGDDDPVAAATDALRSFGADEVIVSTHPPDRSRWLERGVVHQLRGHVGIPVAHVVVDLAENPSRKAATSSPMVSGR